jgi:Xaa-Pro aminopeptidase
MRSPLAAERNARLRAAMKERGLDIVVCYGNAWQCDYLRYVADFALLEGQALALARLDGDVTLYLDSAIEAERARAEAPDLNIVEARSLLGEVEQALDRAKGRIGTAPASLLPRRLAALARSFALTDETNLMDRLLIHKASLEADAIRRAARFADEGYRVFMDAARVGRPDYELIAEVEGFYRAKGVIDNFMIIGVGGPEVRGMAPPSGKRLKRGDLVTTELTPCVDGYYAQICRTLVLGEASNEQTTAFSVFLEALEAGLAAARPGVAAADIARAENDVFRRYGLGQYVTSEYTRVRGHGLGLFPDSKPHILEDVTMKIEPGMALIVHPNTYNPTAGYIVLGDSLLITQSGCEVLNAIPRELFSVSAGP